MSAGAGFRSFSQTRNGDGTPIQLFDPFTTRQVNGAFVRDPFPGAQIPASRFDPVAVKSMAYYPAANRSGDPITNANNFVGTAGLPTNSDAYTIRVDHNINDFQRLFGRWSQKRLFKQLAGEIFGHDNVGGNGTLAPDNRFDGALGYSRAFSPTLVANLSFGSTGGWRAANRRV